MKKLKLMGSAAIAAALALSTTLAKPHDHSHGKSPGTPHAHGTDILHLAVTVKMANNGVEPNASGTVTARQNQQGNANNQMMDMTVNGLTPNYDYEVMAMLASDTNNFVAVDQLTTDSNGSAQAHYRALGNGHNQGHGHGKSPLPGTLNPVSQVKTLAIFDTNSQAVLTADLTAPDQMQYLIKRFGSNGSVGGQMQIKATTSKAQFRLMASGLEPSTDYWLALNGAVVETDSTDAKGRLKIQSNLETPPDILKLNTVELWDTSSNVVLSTTIP